MRDMSSLDIMFLLNELKFLTGGRIQKVYQEEKKIRFEIFVSGKGVFELYFEPGKLFITEYKRKFEEPESFAMLLRKHLKNQKITDFKQKDFDRIVEMETENYIIIFEVFSKGNVILCYKDYKILMPMEIQRWKHRDVKPNIKYEYPPAVANPFRLSFDEFKETLNEKEIVKFLATDLSFSGLYAEELCLRADLYKNRPANILNESELKKLYKAIQQIKDEFGPQAVIEKDKVIDAVPFDMMFYENKEIARSTTFTHALDEFYSKSEEIRSEVEQIKKVEAKVQKLERIAEEQKTNIENLELEEKESRIKADAVFNNLDKINDIIDRIGKMKDDGMKWDEIKDKLKDSVKEINERKGKFIFGEVEIDFRKSAQDNANDYFRRAKHAKRKLEATKSQLEKTFEKIDKPQITEPRRTTIKKKRQLEWYEKFRWAFTTEGFLVIGGKDATQNDMIFNKYIDRDDVVLHAEITGAPLTVIKSGGKEISQATIVEAADLAAAYSSAWKKGLAAVDVYWVKPEQVSKSPESGEYLSKGAFMIRGEKNYLRKIILKVSIGMKEDGTLVAGNVQSVKKAAICYVTVRPGPISTFKLANDIKKILADRCSDEDKELARSIDLDDILRLLPGEGIIV